MSPGHDAGDDEPDDDDDREPVLGVANPLADGFAKVVTEPKEEQDHHTRAEQVREGPATDKGILRMPVTEAGERIPTNCVMKSTLTPVFVDHDTKYFLRLARTCPRACCYSSLGGESCG